MCIFRLETTKSFQAGHQQFCLEKNLTAVWNSCWLVKIDSIEVSIDFKCAKINVKILPPCRQTLRKCMSSIFKLNLKFAKNLSFLIFNFRFARWSPSGRFYGKKVTRNLLIFWYFWMAQGLIFPNQPYFHSELGTVTLCGDFSYNVSLWKNI